MQAFAVCDEGSTDSSSRASVTAGTSGIAISWPWPMPKYLQQRRR